MVKHIKMKQNPGEAFCVCRTNGNKAKWWRLDKLFENNVEVITMDQLKLKFLYKGSFCGLQYLQYLPWNIVHVKIHRSF